MIRDHETLNALLDTVNRFVRERLVPAEALVAETDEIPDDIVQEMKDMGLFGLTVPESYGGLELTMEEEVMVMLAMGQTSPCFRSLFGTTVGIGSQGIVFDGTPEQKAKYLPKLATGELIASFALTEPDAGSEATNVQTTARREGDTYVIHGQKCYITNAPIADLFTVVARTEPGTQGSQGLSAFIVTRDTPGLRTGTPYQKMGQAGSPVSDVYFDHCRIPADHLIGGQEGVGFKTIMKVLNKQRMHLAALCTGPAIRMLDLAIAHTQKRQQFGQPVANFQLMQAMIADSRTEIFAAQSMILEAARARDRGEDVALSASMCKYFASEMCGRVADRCVQMFGGAGYVADFSPIERYYRDVRLFRLYEGTSQIHQLNIAKLVLRDHAN